MSATRLTVRHHPGDDLLLAHAAGALHPAWSLIIETHAALCLECREALRMAEALGGMALEATPPCPCAAKPRESALAETLRRIGDAPPEPRPRRSPAAGPKPVFPQPLRAYTGDLDAVAWRSLGGGVQHKRVDLGVRGGPKARLLRIPPGAPVPDHGHGGMELTLVLSGSFRDGEAVFRRGDLEEADATVNHQPIAGPEGPCVCLAITDAPLRFNALPARIAQFFLRF